MSLPNEGCQRRLTLTNAGPQHPTPTRLHSYLQSQKLFSVSYRTTVMDLLTLEHFSCLSRYEVAIALSRRPDLLQSKSTKQDSEHQVKMVSPLALLWKLDFSKKRYLLVVRDNNRNG